RARELPHGQVAHLDPRARPPRLRLLRPQHPRAEGGRLRHLPRPRRPDAAHVAHPDAAHGVVPRLPPPSRAVPAAARQGVHDGLGAAGRPDRARDPPRSRLRRQQHDELLGLPPMTMAKDGGALAALRAQLATLRDAEHWHALEGLAEHPETAELLARQFPRHAAGLLEPVDRRQFLRLMGASLALAGLGACSRAPTETIVPYVRPPEGLVP